jgi:hypothetical protein
MKWLSVAWAIVKSLLGIGQDQKVLAAESEKVGAAGQEAKDETEKTIIAQKQAQAYADEPHNDDEFAQRMRDLAAKGPRKPDRSAI